MIIDTINNNLIYLNDFSIIFISILVEAFPFIMLGVVISSIIQVVVSQELIERLIPKNIILGSLVGALMGFFFPVCDCGVIPVTKRLIKKGVKINIATSFMLAAPIINPVVLIATWYSFKNINPNMVYYRTIFGLLIAITIGIILEFISNQKDILKNDNCEESDTKCDCGHDCENNHKKAGILKNIKSIINHSYEEFFSVGKYLIIGAFIASMVQIIIPREIIIEITKNQVISIIIMMVFAYLLSLCSTSDSFVAKTFVGQFTNSSILAFLLVGPMIDIKNTIVMVGNFKTKYVLKLILLVFLLCGLVSLISKYVLLF